MKKIAYKLTFLSLLLSAATWMSCTRASLDEPAPVPPAGEEAYLAMSMNIPAGNNSDTRSNHAFKEVWQREEENFIRTVRMVLYDDSAWPTVQYAFDFNILSKADANGHLTELVQYYYDSGDQLVTRPAGETGWYGIPADYSRGKPHLSRYETTDYPTELGGSVRRADQFTTWARRVRVAPYRILLIVNPVSTKAKTDNDVTPANDLYEVTAPGKPLTDLWQAIAVKKEHLRNSANGGFAEDNYFLMTNHDDLIRVSEKDLMPTEQLAHQFPVPVSVSRAVGKIVVMKAENLEVAPAGASAANFRWEPDVTNKKTYWMRKMTWLIDPYGGKGWLEMPGSARMDIYAEDPNFGPVTDKSGHFNYLSAEGNAAPELAYYVVSEAPAANKDLEYAYVLENTMDEDQLPSGAGLTQSEVITTAMISCQYAPKGMAIGSSYYVYNGYVIPLQTLGLFVSDRSKIPNSAVYATLSADIDDALRDGIDLVNPSESFRADDFSYYHEGKNYYPVLIRHGGWDNVAYGYYGIVRNFLYELTINKIKGPGLPTTDIEPTGDGNLEIEIRINKWQERNQNNGVGEKTPRLIVYEYPYTASTRIDWEDPGLAFGLPSDLGHKLVVTTQDQYAVNFQDIPGGYEDDGIYLFEWRTDVSEPGKSHIRILRPLSPYDYLTYSEDQYLLYPYFKSE